MDLMKGITRDKSLHFRYGIYAGLTIYSTLFILGLILTFINIDPLILTLILIVAGYIIWFYAGYKVLDKVRLMCKKFNSFLVLIVMWGTVSSLFVLTTVLLNIIRGQSFYKESNQGFAFGGILLTVIIDFFYKKSRKRLKNKMM